jgi:16S rRNA (cytosine967-C5)-methyltransferase
VLVMLLLIEKMPPAKAAGFFDGGRFAPAPLSAGEQRLLKALKGRTLEHPEMPEAVRLELPEWIVPRLQRAFPEDFQREVAALSQEAAVDLRVNTLTAAREDVIAALRGEGLEAVPTAYSPLGLRLDERAPVAATRAFRDGQIEVQDEASQLAALLVDARPGMRVVDFCAGAGGKTLALAAGMENRGQIVALDVSQGRLDRAGTRLKRAGVHNVERRTVRDHRDRWIKRHKAGFDRVLIDAPCSGTGAWRRNPDARWRLLPQHLDELTRLQGEMLDSAARLVVPGGLLVYATCSVLPEENEDQVAAFLARSDAFQPIPVASLWEGRLNGSCPAREDWLKLTPARHGTDGFFVAVMQRVGSADKAGDEDPEA